MTTFSRTFRQSGSGRRVVRATCASMLMALALGAAGVVVSAAPSADAAPMVTASLTGLQQGSQGSDVKALQQALISAGISLKGGADGVFGPATKTALTSFQKARGLSATGQVDAATASALSGSSASSSSAGLASGSSGASVVALQKRLAELGGFVAGGADGVFGPATKKALMQFQGWNGLSRTGVVDAATAKKLGISSSGGGAAAAPSAASKFLGLKVGSRGAEVKATQQALMNAGISVKGGADGIFGFVTKAALAKYQSSLGITSDGTVNQATIDKLGLTSGAAPVASTGTSTPAASSNKYVGLKVGSNGPLVVELQRSLQKTGLTVIGGADGAFGAATKKALISFQSANGIPATGVVTEKGARILALGSGAVSGSVTPPSGGGAVKMDRFPLQGRCYFGDTWNAPRGGGRQHQGTDVIANEGNLLYAAVDGTISKQYWDTPGALSGNGVRVAQDNGTYFTYLHMSGFAPGIELGTKVKAGDVIGWVGNTGSSSTPHLHFEIHPGGGAAVNPYPYLTAMNDCSNTKARYQSSFG